MLRLDLGPLAILFALLRPEPTLVQLSLYSAALHSLAASGWPVDAVRLVFAYTDSMSGQLRSLRGGKREKAVHRELNAMEYRLQVFGACGSA